jgi:hypothetical protein
MYVMSCGFSIVLPGISQELTQRVSELSEEIDVLTEELENEAVRREELKNEIKLLDTNKSYVWCVAVFARNLSHSYPIYPFFIYAGLRLKN